ncbi:MAG: hypothetical protein IT350_07410 [Deltaproteobacteria bacterium]|nr:hypothetical protein [Deltaproteobacteria bacterium]
MHEFNTFVDYVTFIKQVEYALAFGLMLAFVALYKVARPMNPAKAVRAAVERIKGIAMPADLAFHPGHAWARFVRQNVLVGADDFARKLLGRVTQVVLPAEGAVLRKGARAFTLVVDGRRFDVRSPLDGTVVGVNALAAADADVFNNDPYQAGWLLRVKPADPADVRGSLFDGERAKQWMTRVMDEFFAATHEMGMVAADGGEAVDGLAKAAGANDWEMIARQFLDEDLQ